MMIRIKKKHMAERRDQRHQESISHMSRHSSGIQRSSSRSARKSSVRRPQTQIPSGEMPYPQPTRSFADARPNSRISHIREVQQKKPLSKLKLFALGIGVFVMVAFAVGVFNIVLPSHIEVTIRGKTVELPRETTYSDLREQGYLHESPGDLLAVDSSVLKASGGEAAIIVVNGEMIEHPDTHIRIGDNITEARGKDISEPTKTEERIIPMTIVLEAGDSFQFYGKPLHMTLGSGQEGIELIEEGTLSGISLPGRVVKEMKPIMYGDYQPSFDDKKKVVAFTYDDGPHPTYTQQILDVLRNHGVKATFFMLGTNVETYPHLAKKVVEEGHQVASHSYSHAPEDFLNNLDAGSIAYQVSTAQSVIKDATGIETRVLRPPGGNLKATGVIAGAPWVDAYVGWDVGTGDFNKPGVDHIVCSVHDKIHPGAIVLMHDGGGERKQTVEASDILIGELLDQGYHFVTIDELIEMERNDSNT